MGLKGSEELDRRRSFGRVMVQQRSVEIEEDRQGEDLSQSGMARALAEIASIYHWQRPVIAGLIVTRCPQGVQQLQPGFFVFPRLARAGTNPQLVLIGSRKRSGRASDVDSVEKATKTPAARPARPTGPTREPPHMRPSTGNHS